MIKVKKILPLILFAPFLFISCLTTQTSNREQENDGDLKRQLSNEIESRNQLKTKAFEFAKLIHKLLNERQFEEVYQFIDNDSPLKFPKSKFLKDVQEFVDKFGKLEKIELNEEQITLNNETSEIKQKFIVKFENDLPATTRNETFVWKVYRNNDLKLLTYSTEIEK